MKNTPFMTSPIGDLPIDSEGLKTAIDEIARLRYIIENTVKPTNTPFMTSAIGDLPLNSKGLGTAVDEIDRLRFIISNIMNCANMLKPQLTSDSAKSLVDEILEHANAGLYPNPEMKETEPTVDELLDAELPWR